MQRRRGSARKRVLGCFAIIGAGGIGIAGLLAGWDPTEARSKEPSPAQVVDFRFPAAWNDAPALPAPAVTTVAKQQTAILFDPNPTYALASADSLPALPAALAYADAHAQKAAAEIVPAAADRDATAAERRAASPRPAVRNNVLFNDAQLASIKERLALSPDQEQYWPQVASALRGISYRLGRSQSGQRPVVGSRMASIDPNSAEVQRLKSAAMPLIMSMREDQKREVRALARLMGLEAVASQI
jgi:hypothetical protein